MGDIKLGDIIEPGESGDVVLLGFPYDQGVARNGGRAGARFGPEKFRIWLRRFGSLHNPQIETDLSALKISDAGDIATGLTLEEAHVELKKKVEATLQNGGIPFVVGGGNDQSYPNAAALMDRHRGESVGVINIDAHLDVRPLKDGKAHSGSPFRQLLDDPRFTGNHFIEFATQGSQCTREHAEYVWEQNGRIVWLDDIQPPGSPDEKFRALLDELGTNCPSLFVSFDLDSVTSSEAPGVSCPGILGLGAKDALAMAFSSGKLPSVSVFDLSEYNPTIEEERTGRLAAGMFYYFCLGVASRKGNLK